MKQTLKLTSLIILLAMMFTSCTKEGPQGPAGEDGIDGQNGTASCVECHDDSQVIFAMSNQWAHSSHATGGNYNRNSTSCAPCHTSQGFLEIIQTGLMETDVAISNPNPPNCYTCHNIHDSYTADDWSLTASDPVEFWINGEVSDQGKGNSCITCHQNRVPDPLPDPNGTGTVTISSPYWGPHYGTEGPMFAGTAGYELGSGYTNSMHTSLVDNSCVDCHMAEAYGVEAGGHVMSASYTNYGSTTYLTAGCTDCHSDVSALETKIENTKLEIEGLVDSLETKLIADGLLDAASHRVVPGAYTNDEAGAVYNYIFVAKDGSYGMHNYEYAKKLLQNSLAALK